MWQYCLTCIFLSEDLRQVDGHLDTFLPSLSLEGESRLTLFGYRWKLEKVARHDELDTTEWFVFLLAKLLGDVR